MDLLRFCYVFEKSYHNVIIRFLVYFFLYFLPKIFTKSYNFVIMYIEKETTCYKLVVFTKSGGE